MAGMGAQLNCCLTMILTDREIKISLLKEQIKIDPTPEDEAYSSTAVDLTLDPIARVFRQEVQPGIIIDPGAPDFKFHSISNLLTEQVSTDPSFNLGSKKLLLGWTKESLTLPTQSRLAARVEGKSSLARLGIGVHITAPTIHAGFDGQLQLEIVNHNPTDMVLRAGMRICQLVFETTLGAPEKRYTGLFAGQQSH